LRRPLADEKATLAVAFCFFLNHLLSREDWARQKLAPFAGESLELRAPPLPALRLIILPGGRVEAGGDGASLALTVKPDFLASLARGREYAMRSVEAAGNTTLASEVMLLVRHLRWDAEEDLSRLLGDVAAHRIAQALRDLARWQADAARRLAEALADYAAEEARLLVRRAELGALAGAAAGLRDALERLDKRIGRLE